MELRVTTGPTNTTSNIQRNMPTGTKEDKTIFDEAPERDWNEGLTEEWFTNQEKLKKEIESQNDEAPERDWNEGLTEEWFINQEKLKKEIENKDKKPPSLLSKIKNYFTSKFNVN